MKSPFFLASIIVSSVLVLVGAGCATTSQLSSSTSTTTQEFVSSTEQIDVAVQFMNQNLELFTHTKQDASVPDRGLSIGVYTYQSYKKMTVELTGELRTVIAEYY